MEEYKVLFKAGDYEFDSRLHICYNNGSKFSLAYFENTSEGYDLRFIGDRPFNYCYSVKTSFMEFAMACFKYTEALKAFEEIQK